MGLSNGPAKIHTMNESSLVQKRAFLIQKDDVMGTQRGSLDRVSRCGIRVPRRRRAGAGKMGTGPIASLKRRVRAQDGFSMIELAVALGLAGIIVAGAMFNVRGAMNRESLDGWARSATLDIAAAQQSAITERATANITLTSTSYTLAVGSQTLKVGRMPTDITITTTCASNV